MYDLFVDAGAEFSLTQAGYYAITSVRLDKGYRSFGAELTPDHNPVEAGLLFACKLGTDIDFLGRGAVRAARLDGARRRLVSIAVDDPDPMLWGNELVLRDGVAGGQVTSAGWSDTLGRCVGLAYVHRHGEPVSADYLRSGRYEVNVGGSLYPASVGLRPPYDPTGARIKS